MHVRESTNRRFTWRADLRLLPGCYGNLIVKKKKCACLVDPDRQDELGHFHVHDYRRGSFLLYWNERKVEVFLKGVRSLLSISYKETLFLLANGRAQSWGVFVWTDPLTFIYRKRVHDVWKSVHGVNRLKSPEFESWLVMRVCCITLVGGYPLQNRNTRRLTKGQKHFVLIEQMMFKPVMLSQWFRNVTGLKIICRNKKTFFLSLHHQSPFVPKFWKRSLPAKSSNT